MHSPRAGDRRGCLAAVRGANAGNNENCITEKRTRLGRRAFGCGRGLAAALRAEAEAHAVLHDRVLLEHRERLVRLRLQRALQLSVPHREGREEVAHLRNTPSALGSLTASDDRLLKRASQIRSFPLWAVLSRDILASEPPRLCRCRAQRPPPWTPRPSCRRTSAPRCRRPWCAS